MTARNRGVLLGLPILIALAGSARAATCSPTVFVDAPVYPSGYNPQTAVVGDFDGDGRPDVATLGGGFNGPSISVVLANADGTFGDPIPGPGSSERGCDILDFRISFRCETIARRKYMRCAG